MATWKIAGVQTGCRLGDKAADLAAMRKRLSQAADRVVRALSNVTVLLQSPKSCCQGCPQPLSRLAGPRERLKAVTLLLTITPRVAAF
jgi:hypothetical protein